MSGGEAGHISFAPEPPSYIRGVGWAPSCGYRSLGREVVAIGHWEGGLNRKITDSVVQSSCVSGARQGGQADHIIFAPEPLSCIILFSMTNAPTLTTEHH